jgi:hypothetical protein
MSIDGVMCLLSLVVVLLGLRLAVDALVDVDDLKASTWKFLFSLLVMVGGSLSIGFWALKMVLR